MPLLRRSCASTCVRRRDGVDVVREVGWFVFGEGGKASVKGVLVSLADVADFLTLTTPSLQGERRIEKKLCLRELAKVYMEEFIVALSTAVLTGFLCSALPIAVLTGLMCSTLSTAVLTGFLCSALPIAVLTGFLCSALSTCVLPYLLPCSHDFYVLPYLLPCSHGLCSALSTAMLTGFLYSALSTAVLRVSVFCYVPYFLGFALVFSLRTLP
ncbi:PREDICTED: PRUPE_5G053200 [Prunus dulcis]|uniref:PREDICTED: PRUPE_5G053200 n=1 Tax=Prunus dulcis TaxID=3755 RepID=A0A5E4GG81_PRUDU|nr:PREDICTED: PRUPE_5G053200 [Prunus dulcis]